MRVVTSSIAWRSVGAAMPVPTIADVDNDGDLDIVVSLKDAQDKVRSVVVYEVTGSSANCLAWPTGRGITDATVFSRRADARRTCAVARRNRIRSLRIACSTRGNPLAEMP